MPLNVFYRQRETLEVALRRNPRFRLQILADLDALEKRIVAEEALHSARNPL